MFKYVLLACLLIAAVSASGVLVAPPVVPAVNYGYGRGIRGSYLRDREVSNYAYNDGGYYSAGYPGYYGYNGLGYGGLGYNGYYGYPYGGYF